MRQADGCSRGESKHVAAGGRLRQGRKKSKSESEFVASCFPLYLYAALSPAEGSTHWSGPLCTPTCCPSPVDPSGIQHSGQQRSAAQHSAHHLEVRHDARAAVVPHRGHPVLEGRRKERARGRPVAAHARVARFGEHLGLAVAWREGGWVGVDEEREGLYWGRNHTKARAWKVLKSRSGEHSRTPAGSKQQPHPTPWPRTTHQHAISSSPLKVASPDPVASHHTSTFRFVAVPVHQVSGPGGHAFGACIM